MKCPGIGDQINKHIIAPITEANNLGNLPDFNDDKKLGTGKEMQERLKRKEEARIGIKQWQQQ